MPLILFYSIPTANTFRWFMSVERYSTVEETQNCRLNYCKTSLNEFDSLESWEFFFASRRLISGEGKIKVIFLSLRRNVISPKPYENQMWLLLSKQRLRLFKSFFNATFVFQISRTFIVKNWFSFDAFRKQAWKKNKDSMADKKFDLHKSEYNDSKHKKNTFQSSS